MSETEKESIIVVDDVQANLRLLCEILSTAPYRIRPFSNPQAALQSAKEDPAHLYLLDVNMPEMNGYQLCQSLKQYPQTQDAPVIFISASRETSDVVEGLRNGAVDYVAKPFHSEEVLTRIDTHLKLQRTTQSLNKKNETLRQALLNLKETQSKLIQSEKMASLGTLTAGIAHEINNPVCFVLANARLLAKKLSQEDAPSLTLNANDLSEWRDMIESVIDGSERISEIVSSLQTYSRHEENSHKPFDPKANIEATLRMYRHEIEGKVDLQTHIEAPKQSLFANPGQINQVVANLISNAIAAAKQSNAAARIAIRAENAAETYTISVQDNGPGIADNHLRQIFDPFFTTKPPGKGLGLGLYIASRIIEDHRGTIELDTSNKGTTMKVVLPFGE